MKAAETDLAPSERAFRSGGTESSNPASSSGESAANLRRGSFGVVVTDPCLSRYSSARVYGCAGKRAPPGRVNLPSLAGQLVKAGKDWLREIGKAFL
jgi:hypothetical protein